MNLRKAGLAAAAVATVGAGVIGGAAIATASDDTAGAARYGYGFGHGGGPEGGPGGGPAWQHGGPFDDSEVTGAELASVTDAVSAYDDTLTVEHVVKAEDGSFLVYATTADDAREALTVSADLATVAEAEGPFGGPGGPGRFGAEEVTGDELADVTAAVEAHDAALTVEHVLQRDDEGDYLVLASGGEDERTALRVSADLKTVEELEGPPGGPPGGPGRGPGGGPDGVPPGAGAEQSGYTRA